MELNGKISSLAWVCWNALINFVYPEHCFGCEERIESKVICEACSSRLGEEIALRAINGECDRNELVLLSRKGIGNGLMKRLIACEGEEYYSGIAALFLQAIVQLNWPWPEVIVPFPTEFSFQDRSKRWNQFLAHSFQRLVGSLGNIRWKGHLHSEIFPLRLTAHNSTELGIIYGRRVLLMGVESMEGRGLSEVRERLSLFEPRSISFLALIERSEL